MSQIVNEQYTQTRFSDPSAQKKKGTMFDEIRGALETSHNPIDRAIQMIAEFHGAWTGGSSELFSLASFLSNLTGSNTLRQQAMQIGDAACAVQEINNNRPPSMVGRQNNDFAAIMPTAQLRDFVNSVHNIHPAINLYFQLHNDSFPYFQQISEEVGRFAVLNMRSTEIDPMKWPNQRGVNCLETNTRMDSNTLHKMFPSTFFQMDNASNLLNTMFLRSMRPENNMSLLHDNYSQEQPIAHGHNFCMDVHGAKRRTDAIADSSAVVMDSAGDSLRLINKFFPVHQVNRYETEEFEITLNSRPDGSPVTYIVDKRGQLFNNTKETDRVNNPTNHELLTVKEADTNEVR